MSNKKQIELIARVITLPFADFSFYYNDLIATYINKHNILNVNADVKFDLIKSKEIKKELLELMQDIIGIVENKVRIKRNDNIKQIMNAFYSPYEIMSHELNIETQYLLYIMRTARTFLTFRDGTVSIKWWVNNPQDIFCENGKISDHMPDKVEIWNTLMRVFTPDVYIAALYASADHLTVEHLVNVREYVSLLDKPLSKVLEKGIAETHFHMNAGSNYLSIWEIMCNIIQIIASRNRKNKDSPLLLIAGLLRLFFAYILKYTSNPIVSDKDKLLNSFCKALHLSNDFEITCLGTCFEGKLSYSILEELYNDFIKDGPQREFLVVEFLKEEFSIESDFNFSDLGDILGATLFREYDYLHTPYEIIMEFKVFRLIKKMINEGEITSCFFCSLVKMFVQYIRIKNCFFDDKIQGNVYEGLDKFISYFDNATDAIYKIATQRSSEKMYRNNLKNIYKSVCSQLSLRKLEVRVSPPIGNIKRLDSQNDEQVAIQMGNQLRTQLINIFESYLEYYDDEIRQYEVTLNYYYSTESERRKNINEENLYSAYADELQSKHISTFPALGIVYHFIKHRDFDNFITNGCWAFEEREFLDQSIQNIRDKFSLFIKVLSMIRSKIPNLSKYIVGIDAASVENETEPWVLAPVFLKSRSAELTYPSEIYGLKINNLGVTYHVGEDYYHLLSGLRHIYEVITYFGYKSGDRIGHAIALQIDAFEWANENKMIAMPRIEYLDNLLWLWNLQSVHPELFNEINVNFEHKIMEVSELLYGSNSGLSPYILWQAYIGKFSNLDFLTRKNFRDMYISEKAAGAQGNIPEERILCKYYTQKCPRSCVSAVCNLNNKWDKDKLIMTYHCPIYNRHYYKSIFVPVTNIDAECIKIIQKYIKKEIEENGIYVEINPTSNAVIGGIHNIYEHPFINLNDNGIILDNENNVMISINSDDPLIFNTNIENELAIAYYTLLHKGCDRTKALYWIDRIRQYGMDSSFIRLEISPSAQRKELKSIIKELRDMDVESFIK